MSTQTQPELELIEYDDFEGRIILIGEVIETNDAGTHYRIQPFTKADPVVVHRRSVRTRRSIANTLTDASWLLEPEASHKAKEPAPASTSAPVPNGVQPMAISAQGVKYCNVLHGAARMAKTMSVEDGWAVVAREDGEVYKVFKAGKDWSSKYKPEDVESLIPITAAAEAAASNLNSTAQGIKTVTMLVEAIGENGPMTTSALGKALNMDSSGIGRHLRNHPDIFTRDETQRPLVWDLVE